MIRKVLIYNLEKTIAAQSQRVMAAKVNIALTAEFEKAKAAMLRDFDKHGVTKELSSEDENPAEKESEFIDYGNLFSFLGVDEGTDVSQIVREVLEMVTRVKRSAKFNRNVGKRFVFDLQVQAPTSESINEATRILEWTSKGIIDLIQNGSPGYSKYLYSLVRTFKNSRSGTALQIKRRKGLREGRFSGVDWTDGIMDKFEQRLLKL